MTGSVLRIPPVTRDPPSRCQRRHLQTKSNQGVAMRNKVVRVGHPVALDIGPVGVIRIGPPVVTFGEVVVLSASAALRTIRGDGDGTLAKIPVRST